MNKNSFVDAIWKEPDASLLRTVTAHLRQGCDPNQPSSHGALPIVVAFRRGRMDAVSLLASHGADLAPLGWGPLHHAVALGSVEEVGALVSGDGVSSRDRSDLTPFLLAVDIGNVAKASVLLPVSTQEDTFRRTPDRVPALVIAAEKNRLEMVKWLLANGFDANEEAEFGRTALITAAANDSPGIVEVLLDAGARISAKDNITAYLSKRDPAKFKDWEHETFHTPMSETSSSAVARLLMRSGAELSQFGSQVIREFTGSHRIPRQEITPEIFHAQKHRKFGTRNPEAVAYAYWLQAIRGGLSGSDGRREFGVDVNSYPAIWSYDRFGMSTTELPDGRWVQIAGEHEDWYDVDFCIYSDVFVFDGKGGVQIYIYPRDVFPPTDFHTATLYDGQIITIGNAGYPEDRQPGTTQVMRLSLDGFSIARLETSGTTPGWISNHHARLEGDKIIVRNGEIWTGNDFVPNRQEYQLCLASGAWSECS